MDEEVRGSEIGYTMMMDGCMDEEGEGGGGIPNADGWTYG